MKTPSEWPADWLQSVAVGGRYTYVWDSQRGADGIYTVTVTGFGVSNLGRTTVEYTHTDDGYRNDANYGDFCRLWSEAKLD